MDDDDNNEQEKVNDNITDQSDAEKKEYSNEDGRPETII